MGFKFRKYISNLNPNPSGPRVDIEHREYFHCDITLNNNTFTKGNYLFEGIFLVADEGDEPVSIDPSSYELHIVNELPEISLENSETTTHLYALLSEPELYAMTCAEEGSDPEWRPFSELIGLENGGIQSYLCDDWCNEEILVQSGYYFLASEQSILAIPQSGTLINAGISAKVATYTDTSENTLSQYFKGNLQHITADQLAGATQIVEKSFSGNTALRSIELPDTLITIGESAFADCPNLDKVVIPSSLTTIGQSAFRKYNDLIDSVHISDLASWCKISGLANLTPYVEKLYVNNEIITELTIPDTVESISNSAFKGLTTITSLQMSPDVKYIEYDSFSGCESLASVTLSQNLETIGNSAFQYAALRDLNIPNSLTDIGQYAFGDCTNLTCLTIPNNVTRIGHGAFYGCSNLERVTIENSAMNLSIGSAAFTNCTGLTRVDISDLAHWCNISFGNSDANPLFHAKNLYVNDELVTHLVIPESITEIKPYAFCNCANLLDINISDTVTAIGDQAFRGCCDLTSIIIPDSVTQIGYGVLRDWKNLEELTIPFVGSSASETYTTSTKYKGVFGYIFDYISNSSSAAVAGTTYQCQASTSYSTKYYHYYIPESLKKVTITAAKTINSSAFYNCANLTEIILPDTLESIEAHAFCHCTGLTSIKIPDAVKSIGTYAFYGCDGLTAIEIPNNVTSIDSFAFQSCKALTNVVIGDNVKKIRSRTFANCTNLSSVVIPVSVTSIDTYIFDACNNLTYIYYKGTLNDWNKINIIYTASSNKELRSAPKYFYSENQPTESGNYWHYDENGAIVIWLKLFSAGLNYTLNSGSASYSVTGIGTCTDTDVKIPMAYNGKPITSIGSSAFADCTSLTSVTIPNTITSIGDGVVSGCSSLTAVYYAGTEAEWLNISVGADNSNLTSITRYYYSETEPEVEGNYWHYDENGTPTPWEAV